MKGIIVAFVTISMLIQQKSAQPQRDIFSFDNVGRSLVTNGRQDDDISKSNGNKIPTFEINLYYEAFCGGCSNYFKHQLYTTYDLLGKYLKITLLPYGNASEKPDPEKPGQYIFDCQHGSGECLSNLYQACFLSKTKDTKLQMELVKCLIEKQDVEVAARECMKAIKAGHLSFEEVKQCADGPEGNALMHQLAVATDALEPPHRYTPWVTIDGKHIKNIEEHLLASVLCAGKLKNVPECRTSNSMMVTKHEKSQIDKCYRTDSPPPTVHIAAYYEALCGGCIGFITEQLQPTFLKLSKHIEVDLYPYGNTWTSKDLDPYGDHIFVCQHGVEECLNNLFQACLLDKIKDQAMQVNLISCLMGANDPIKRTEECMMKFKVTSVSFDEIQNCANYDEGNKLMYKLSVATESLKPPRKYAPWLTLNGLHSETIQTKMQEDLFKFLCQEMLKGVRECQPEVVPDVLPIVELV